MYKNLMRLIGLRSKCCNQKIVAWSADKFYCDGCKKTIGTNTEVPGYTPSTTLSLWEFSPKES